MTEIRRTLIIALFAALMAVGSYIRIPLPPVPITLQTFFVYCAALMCGWKLATISTVVYLIIGIIGVPVFTTGGGIGALLGPTGGFLFALVPAVLVAGMCSDAGYKRAMRDEQFKRRTFIAWAIVGGILATICIYAGGVPWLKYQRHLSWMQAIAAGMLPFLIGDTVKIIAAVFLSALFTERIRGDAGGA